MPIRPARATEPARPHREGPPLVALNARHAAALASSPVP